MPPEENDKHETSGSAEKQQNDCSDVTASSVEAPYVSTENRDIAEGTNEVEHWNKPFANIGRLVFAFLSFIIAGMNDGAVGALIPYLEEYYNLSYTTVSLVFLTPFVGYSLAAFTNATIHMKWGQRGIAFIAPICHIITYAVLAIHPPWPVLIIINIFRVSAMGHAMPASVHGLSVLACAYDRNKLCGFGKVTMVYLLLRHGRAGEFEKGGVGLRDALKSKVTWLCAAFFFAYMGAEVGIGGWVVTFMLRIRNASRYASGVSGTAFWAVPDFIVSAVSVAFLGVFLGPLFPGAVMVTAKLLPQRIHVSAIGFAMAIGGTGGTIFPFIIGAIASHAGVGVLQPIILALIALVTIIWLNFPHVSEDERVLLKMRRLIKAVLTKLKKQEPV
ncbi:unnamed protein product, partial [Clonostachys rosea f. rosea IK726]